MIRNDYILREIDQLVQFVLKLFGLEAREIEELTGEIDAAARRFTGLNLTTLKRLTADQYLEMCRTGMQFNYLKIFSAAILLAREAEAKARLTGDPVDAPVQMAKALILFNACLTQPDEAFRHRARTEVERFLPRLADLGWVSTDLVRFHELTGDFSRAEDTLFELLNRTDGAALEFAVPFYERLLEKADEELEAGNLPRDEIEESLAFVRSKSEVSNEAG